MDGLPAVRSSSARCRPPGLRHNKTLPTPCDRKIYAYCGHVPNAINVVLLCSYFVIVTLLFQLLAKHSSAALPCKQFVSKRL